MCLKNIVTCSTNVAQILYLRYNMSCLIPKFYCDFYSTYVSSALYTTQDYSVCILATVETCMDTVV